MLCPRCSLDKTLKSLIRSGTEKAMARSIGMISLQRFSTKFRTGLSQVDVEIGSLRCEKSIEKLSQH